jgi:DNA processing protein
MMQQEQIFQVALTMVPHIGHVHAKLLVEKFVTATAIFSAPIRELESMEGMGPARALAIRSFNRFGVCEQILQRASDHGISTVFLSDEKYPKRMLNCYDPPTLLYYKGSASLNVGRTVAVIGTRHHTEYGRQQTEKFVKELEGKNITIISGMAYGIDALAHKAALKNRLPTIGILAHGMDSIYPPEHKGLALEMLKENGGLLTEFPVGVKADKHRFPVRNRIVAGISDAVVVVETGIKGGSMITADLANGYDHDVYAFPGRASDIKSSGCNLLIRQNKAVLIADAATFLAEAGWMETVTKENTSRQLSLSYEMDPSESIIVHLLGIHEILPIDELYLRTGLDAGTAASAILTLELRNIIVSLPGKRYRLCI